jgi:glycerophosphoryl diester phosphodiesterase
VEQPTVPIVIAHRGASGYLPEHTLAGYAVAVLQGADFVEPDLVMTRDGHLVCRHDHVLDLTTDVASRPEFADRRTTKVTEGVAVTAWFSEDFTLAEIQKLRAVERMADIRPANTRFDGQFEVPTLTQLVELVQALEQATGRPIGIYPEVKHPTYFSGLGLSMEEPMVDILRRNGYEEMRERVYVQSFEVCSLKKLRRICDLPLIQLLAPEGGPYDVKAAGGTLTYERMATPAGLAEIATYADGVGPEKARFIIPVDPSGRLDGANATGFVADAHALGLKVHTYTFRAENRFLPANYRSPSGKPNEPGDLAGEIRAFLATGIDGFFTDQPHIGVRARDGFSARPRPP